MSGWLVGVAKFDIETVGIGYVSNAGGGGRSK